MATSTPPLVTERLEPPSKNLHPSSWAKSTYLNDLPDELALHILSNFHYIRSYECQSQAFEMRDTEVARQRDNRARRSALHALCLTSRNIKRLAEPILYSALATTTTKNQTEIVNGFYSTIKANSYLAACVQYVENRFEDSEGNSFQDDLENEEHEWAAQFFDHLASIVLSAPNVEHLSIVSAETGNLAFCRQSGLCSKDATPQEFQKLEHLCLQTHMITMGDQGYDWFDLLVHRLMRIPCLKQLRLSGVLNDAPVRFDGTFDRLHILDITECSLDSSTVAGLVNSCKSLQHFACQWSYLDDGSCNLATLSAALRKHSGSLRYLWIACHNVLTMDELNSGLGNLHNFTALKHLEIDQMAIVGTPAYLRNSFQWNIPKGIHLSNLLPPNLETLQIHMADLNADPGSVDAEVKVDALWDLSDCPSPLPDLKTFIIHPPVEVHMPELGERFKSQGVDFHVHYDWL